MLGILSKFFDSNNKEVQKLVPVVDEINALDEKIKKLKDTDFPRKTRELKERIASGENIFLILPEALNKKMRRLQ